MIYYWVKFHILENQKSHINLELIIKPLPLCNIYPLTIINNKNY